MGELARFDGIVIQMYPDDHPWPHFHVRYSGTENVFDLRTMLFARRTHMPVSEQKKVIDWAEDYEDELWEQWDRAEAGKPVERID